MKTQDRAAVNLNNQGVDLIRRRCYRQGLSCLVDALTIVHSSDNPLVCLDTLLQKAARQMANPEPLMIDSTKDHCDVVVISEDNDVYAIQLRLSREKTDAGTTQDVFLIRIEAFDSNTEIEHKELQTAIMLHNTGSAYRLLAFVVEKIGTYLETASLRLFHSSYILMTSFCQKSQVEDLCKVTMISLLVLQNLTTLSQRLKLHDHWVVYSHRLQALLQTSDGIQMIMSHDKVVAEAA